MSCGERGHEGLPTSYGKVRACPCSRPHRCTSCRRTRGLRVGRCIVGRRRNCSGRRVWLRSRSRSCNKPVPRTCPGRPPACVSRRKRGLASKCRSHCTRTRSRRWSSLACTCTHPRSFLGIPCWWWCWRCRWSTNRRQRARVAKATPRASRTRPRTRRTSYPTWPKATRAARTRLPSPRAARASKCAWPSYVPPVERRPTGEALASGWSGELLDVELAPVHYIVGDELTVDRVVRLEGQRGTGIRERCRPAKGRFRAFAARGNEEDGAPGLGADGPLFGRAEEVAAATAGW